jgi:hypothetical protein
MRLAYEMLQHLFGNLKVRNDPVSHRANRNDVAGCSAKHLFCLHPDSFDVIGRFIDSDDRGLTYHHSPPTSENKRVCSAQINSQVTRPKAGN